MEFNEFMALILPSVVALLFYSKLKGRALSHFEIGALLATFVLLTNCICYAAVVYFKKIPSFDMLFTLKYSGLAIFVSLLLTIVYRFIELNIKIKLKVEPRDEEK